MSKITISLGGKDFDIKLEGDFAIQFEADFKEKFKGKSTIIFKSSFKNIVIESLSCGQ